MSPCLLLVRMSCVLYPLPVAASRHPPSPLWLSLPPSRESRDPCPCAGNDARPHRSSRSSNTLSRQEGNPTHLSGPHLAHHRTAEQQGFWSTRVTRSETTPFMTRRRPVLGGCHFLRRSRASRKLPFNGSINRIVAPLQGPSAAAAADCRGAAHQARAHLAHPSLW